MKFEIEKVGGIGEYTVAKKLVGKEPDTEEVAVYFAAGGEAKEPHVEEVGESSRPRAFLIVRKNTLEVRTDAKLKRLLQERYESVMESRYFGRGGVEIVNSGQISDDEINDLVRLSYQLSKKTTK